MRAFKFAVQKTLESALGHEYMHKWNQRAELVECQLH